jgi:hypothetical protein
MKIPGITAEKLRKVAQERCMGITDAKRYLMNEYCESVLSREKNVSEELKFVIRVLLHRGD